MTTTTRIEIWLSELPPSFHHPPPPSPPPRSFLRRLFSLSLSPSAPTPTTASTSTFTIPLPALTAPSNKREVLRTSMYSTPESNSTRAHEDDARQARANDKPTTPSLPSTEESDSGKAGLRSRKERLEGAARLLDRGQKRRVAGPVDRAKIDHGV